MNPVQIALAIAIVIAALTGAAVLLMKSCARMPGEIAEGSGEAVVRTADQAAHKAVDLGKRVWDGVGRRLNIRPEIRIDRETEIAFDRGVLELVTLKRGFTHEYTWENTWLGSTKSIRLKGYFTASVGFDLNEHFYLNIHSENLRVDLEFPPPRLLACELNDYKALVEQGYWNRLSEAERHEAINAMIASARQAMGSNQEWLAEAKRMLLEQIGDVILQNGGNLGFANDAPFPQLPE